MIRRYDSSLSGRRLCNKPDFEPGTHCSWYTVNVEETEE